MAEKNLLSESTALEGEKKFAFLAEFTGEAEE